MFMRKKILILAALLGILASASAQESPATDTLATNRFVMRSTLYGVGCANLLDTYLSPVEYTGVEARIVHERMRMTKLLDGNVSKQSLLQVNFGYTENRSETGNELFGLVNWSCGLHYHFHINDHLTLLAGGLGEMNMGFIYNTRNSNNPAQAKAYVNLTASGMAIYKFRLWNRPFAVRYQLNVPMVGVMFSPQYQQSYYEIFTLGNSDGTVKLTSLHNQPSCRQLLTLDIPTRSVTYRIGYVGDFQQSRVNGIKCHTYSHTFMVGLVKRFYLIKPGDKSNSRFPF